MRPLVDQPADRREAGLAAGRRLGPAGVGEHQAHRLGGELVAQLGVRMHEGGAGHVQAHRLEQHLVAVGGAVEGAGAGAVVRGRLGGVAARRGRSCRARTARAPWSSRCSPGRSTSARRARTRTAGGRSGARRSAGPGTILSQMPSSSAASKTSCESATAVPMAMVSRENRLSSMPARPWVTPSHIAGTPPATWAVAPSRCAVVADHRREALVRLVRRQHVVVGGDDADVGRALGDDAQLVDRRQRRRGMRQVGAAEPLGAARPGEHRVDPRQVVAPARRRCARGCAR